MSKPRNLTITIPEPCTVPWDTMHTVDQYRKHCDSCATVVTDFTSMTDDELVSYLQDRAGQKNCGRFRKDQLGKPLPLLPVKKQKAVWWKAALLLPLTFLHKIGHAQQQDTVRTEQKDSSLALTATTDSTLVVQPDTAGFVNDSLSQVVVVDSLYQDIPDSIKPPFKCELKFDPTAVHWILTGKTDGFYGDVTYVLGGFGYPGKEFAVERSTFWKALTILPDTLTQLKETVAVAIRQLTENDSRAEESLPEPVPQQPGVPAENENIVAVLTDNKRVPKRKN